MTYTQDALMAYLEPDEERALIEKCIGVFKKLTGAPPKGWLSPVLAPTAHTEDIIADTGFLWYGDYNHIDLPFCVNTGKGTLVALPHSDFADHRVLRGNTRDWYDVYKDTFDYLYANEPTSYLNITLHCHFGGRPLMAAQFDRILKYIRGFPGAWFVRHDELAQWIKSNNIGEWTNQQRFFPRLDVMNRVLRARPSTRVRSVSPRKPVAPALVHEGAAAFAEIFRVHAGGADRLDRGHVALVGIPEYLRDGDLGRLNGQRRVARNGAGDLRCRVPQLSVGYDAIDQADPQGLSGIDPHARIQQQTRPRRPDQRDQMVEALIAIGDAELGGGKCRTGCSRPRYGYPPASRPAHAAAKAGKAPDAGAMVGFWIMRQQGALRIAALLEYSFEACALWRVLLELG